MSKPRLILNVVQRLFDVEFQRDSTLFQRFSAARGASNAREGVKERVGRKHKAGNTGGGERSKE